MSTAASNRRLAAIMVADMVGYSRMMEADEAGTHSALQRIWDETFNPAVAARHGRIVKRMGDGVLVEFGSVVVAVDDDIAEVDADAKLDLGPGGANRSTPRAHSPTLGATPAAPDLGGPIIGRRRGYAHGLRNLSQPSLPSHITAPATSGGWNFL